MQVRWVSTAVMAGVLLSVAAGPVGAAIVSDDFNTCAIDPQRWTIVDPVGDSSVTLTGTGTQDAYATISIPAGVSHDLWAGYNDSVRLLQTVDNADFNVQLKFDSQLSVAYQSQGLLIEQSSGVFVRYDMVHDGNSLSLFAATINNSTATVRREAVVTNAAPFWLGIQRSGNNWTLTYSNNGQNWTTLTTFSFSMTVARMGPFAANYSSHTAPAVVAKVDYFLNTAAPFSVEDGSLPAYTLNRTVTGQGSITANPDQTAYACAENVTLTAMPANGWTFQNWTGDLSGTNPVQTVAMTGSRSVNAVFVPQTPTPLQITNVNVTPSQTGAVITWITNNAATSSVAYGLTDAYGLGPATETTAVTSHSVALSGLQPSTMYHYAITCQDTMGGNASTADATFTTASPPTGDFVSDDFNRDNINTDLWTINNPTGDAAFAAVGAGTSDARVQITMPAGVSHEAWTSGIHAPWLSQQVANRDFGIQAKFDSNISGNWKVQGLIFQESASRFVRVDFYSEGSGTYLYACLISNGADTTYVNRSVPAGAPYYLRVSRASDQWTVQYSKNGNTWTTGASFRQALNVTAIGPYAANEGSPAPAFTALVDYVFNVASPILAEDGQPPPADTTPPTLLSIQTVPYQTSIDVSWNTDEPARSTVQYGRTTAYELGTITDASYQTGHLMNIPGLTIGTTYNVRVTATDAAGNTSQSDNLSVTTISAQVGPTIDVWYGDQQEFNRIGTPLPVVNVLGNVFSTNSTVSSLSYSLNGGPNVALSLGSDHRRLAQDGDFNADIDVGSLLPGNNQLVLTARDALGAQTNRTVTVVNSAGAVWPLPYSINWNSAGSINDVAQITDGLWTIEGGGARPIELSYDRLIAMGERTWTNFQVTVPVTVLAVDPNGYASPSNGPGVGVLLRWPGNAYDGNQPAEGIYPLGGIPMYRWTNSYERFEIFGNNGYLLTSSNTGEKLVLGVTYIFKARVQTITGRSYYYFKWWRQGQTEPANWILTGSQTSDPGAGCLVLLAHHVDARFGNVLVEP